MYGEGELDLVNLVFSSINLISLVAGILILLKLVKIFSSASELSTKEQKEAVKQSKKKQEDTGIHKRASYSNQAMEEDTKRVYEQIKQEKPTPKKYPKKQVKYKEYKKEEKMRQLVLEKQLKEQEEQEKNQDERYETIFGACDFDEVSFLEVDGMSLLDSSLELPAFIGYKEQGEEYSVYRDCNGFEDDLK